MRYRVAWDSDAFRSLQIAVENVNDLEPVIRAFEEIEAQLSTDAESIGESRESDRRRILIVRPLAVIFRARPEMQEVMILETWMIPSRK